MHPCLSSSAPCRTISPPDRPASRAPAPRSCRSPTRPGPRRWRRWSRTARTPRRRCRRSPRRSSWRKAFPASSGRRYRVRPKLVATQVSGCHLVLVICGPAAAVGRQGPAATACVTCPSLKIWAGSLPESHSRGHRPDRHRGGRTPLMAVPPHTVTGPGSRGQAGESPGSGGDRSPAWSQDCKGDLGVEHRRGIHVTGSREHRRIPRPPGDHYAAVSSGPPRRPGPKGRHDVGFRTRQDRSGGPGTARCNSPALAFGTPPDRASAIRVLQAAVAAGVDHIDTAQYYGPDVVNDLIREALYPYPDGLAIVSKVAVRRDASGAVLPFDDPDQLRTGIEDNLRSLRLGQLAVVNLRLLGDGRVDARFDDQLAAMVAARDEGLIAGIGLSNISLEQLQHAPAGTDIACVQNMFHLADRRGARYSPMPPPGNRVRAVLPALLASWPGQPRAQQRCGIQAAARLDVTPAQVALQWLLQLARTSCSSQGPARSPTCRRTWPPNAWRSMIRRLATWTASAPDTACSVRGKSDLTWLTWLTCLRRCPGAAANARVPSSRPSAPSSGRAAPPRRAARGHP